MKGNETESLLGAPSLEKNGGVRERLFSQGDHQNGKSAAEMENSTCAHTVQTGAIQGRVPRHVFAQGTKTGPHPWGGLARIERGVN